MTPFGSFAILAAVIVGAQASDENGRALLARRLAADPAPTGYTLEDNKHPKAGKSETLKFASGYKGDEGYGGKLKMADCMSYCDSTKGCQGFNFRYKESEGSSKEIYECTGYKDLSPIVMEDYSGGTVGSAFYKRTEVSDGSAKFSGFQGDAAAAPKGYTVEDNVGCDGGDKKDNIYVKDEAAKKGTRKDLTVDECVQHCESHKDCIAFSHSYNPKAPYEGVKGYCVMWTKCEIPSIGKAGSAWYTRDAGKSAGTGAAPDGTGQTSETVGRSTTYALVLVMATWVSSCW